MGAQAGLGIAGQGEGGEGFCPQKRSRGGVGHREGVGAGFYQEGCGCGCGLGLGFRFYQGGCVGVGGEGQ